MGVRETLIVWGNSNEKFVNEWRLILHRFCMEDFAPLSIMVTKLDVPEVCLEFRNPIVVTAPVSKTAWFLQ